MLTEENWGMLSHTATAVHLMNRRFSRWQHGGAVGRDSGNKIDNCVVSVYTENVGETPMKQRDLVRKLETSGFVFERHGGNHDIYRRGNDIEKVPRHKEINEKINENLAKMILKK